MGYLYPTNRISCFVNILAAQQELCPDACFSGYHGFCRLAPRQAIARCYHPLSSFHRLTSAIMLLQGLDIIGLADLPDDLALTGMV